MATEQERFEALFYQLDAWCSSQENYQYAMAHMAEMEELEQIQTIYRQEEIRRAVQMVYLKGFHHTDSMTPDVIAMFAGYLVQQLLKPHEKVLDPAMGTGNLLAACLNQATVEKVEWLGVEEDHTLHRYAKTLFAMLGKPIQLFEGKLQKHTLSPVNLIVTELPPQLEQAEERIIQAWSHLTTDGKMLCVMPQSFFQSTLFQQLKAEGAHLLMNLTLPSSLIQGEFTYSFALFSKEKGREEEACLQIELPSFQEREKLEKAMELINYWLKS